MANVSVGVQPPRREPGGVNSLYCECGNRKSCGATQCPRCAFLDGKGSAQRAILETLAEVNAATFADLIEETGFADRVLRRTLKALVQQGRVVRRWSEHLGTHVHWAVVP